MATFAELVDDLSQELESLVTRFKAPMPPNLPFSESCPPAHEASQSFLVISLQNYWIDYTQGLIRLSMEGGQATLSGSLIARTVPQTVARMAISKAADTVATRLNLHWPIWQNCAFVAEVAAELKLENAATIALELGSNMSAGYTTSVRNYLVHPEVRLRDLYRKVANTHGLPYAEPVPLLNSPRLGGIPLFEYWVRSILATARGAAQ